MKKNKFEFIIDSEFQSQIPALTDEEFQQLEENILSEGEVLSPLIVWGNILVDGHNRYKILQQHPEIPYTTRSISCTCETREDVLAWICKHQLGRRNLTPEQKKFLIGKQYHSEKSTRGGNHGNQYTQVANCQIDNLPSVENTTERIAKENNVSPSFVIRAEQFMKTVELMEKYCPGIQEEILSGKLKLSQREATIIRGTPTTQLSLPPQSSASTNSATSPTFRCHFEHQCPRQDSNLHVVKHTHLKRARLPIPPLGLKIHILI